MRDIGSAVPGWSPPPWPDAPVLEGRYTRLERLSLDHAADLFAANSADDRIWDWLFYEPFQTLEDYRDWVSDRAGAPDAVYYAIRAEDGRWSGVASLMRINPTAGSIEIGDINISKRLQRSRAATEALTLMIRWAFKAGYRRLEWKCNALNLPSRRAAERLGLSYEGTFRQAMVIKGHNRDTAWYAAIDGEWPALAVAYDAWLDAANFDAAGQQISSLSGQTGPVLVARDPALLPST
ncbi:GNAT family N-acetyltransferase [Actibacterium sp. 188UL27-1]|uniref:GNAT family N-acetyltransferase n=1 Tax=Actibacterium sp. 188UL27-1 TaxID=2786961 RepID=UPI00195C5806|nr:GNAT family protein [Actibacterium sp. 188UL27-1]MBM7068091.1 GNAT family N-acetyltransferase [Actibacterium sp. 188UL27-1]